MIGALEAMTASAEKAAKALEIMSDVVQEQRIEIERYRKTLRDIVRQCNNPIHTSPAGMDRIIERVEEMAIDALGPQLNALLPPPSAALGGDQ